MADKNEEKDRWTLLAEAAVELNEVLGLEPEIETEEVTEAYLEEKVGEACSLVREDDEFTDQTDQIVAEFLQSDEDAVEEETDSEETSEVETEMAETTNAGEEVEEAEEVEGEDAEEYSLAEIREFVEGTKKRKDLRVFAQEFPDTFKPVIDEMNEGGLRSGEDFKESMLSRLDELEADEEDFEVVDDADESDVDPADEKSSSSSSNKGGKSMTQEAREFLIPLLEEGNHSQKELREMVVENGCSKATASVILSDSKNPDYNSFDRLVVENEEGNLQFEKE